MLKNSLMDLYARIKNGEFEATEELGVLAKSSKINMNKLYDFIKKGGYSDRSAGLATCAIGYVFKSDPSQVDVKKVIKGLRHKRPEVRLNAGNTINQMVGHDYERMSVYVPEVIKTAKNPLYTDSIASTTKQMVTMYSSRMPEALVPYVFELFTNDSQKFNDLYDIINELLIPKLSNDLLKKSLETLLVLGEFVMADFIGNSYWIDDSTVIKPNFLLDNSPELVALIEKPYLLPSRNKSPLRDEGKFLIENIAKRINNNCPSKAILDAFKVKPADFSIKLFSDNELAIYAPAKIFK